MNPDHAPIEIKSASTEQSFHTQSTHLETNTIHAGKMRDAQYGSLSTPIYQTSTYVFEHTLQGSARFKGEEQGYIYGRLGNPTVRELELRMAALEQTEDAAATASGMGAISSVIFSLVKSGDHIIASSALYGCTFALFAHQCKQFNIDVTFVDINDYEMIENSIQNNTKVIFTETPINPNLICVDLDKLASIAKIHNLISIVDNTFMTPFLQRPVTHGIDIVIHSATKYLNGHGDVIAGIICASKDIISLIKSTTLKDMGAILSPHDAWLIIRGLKTLHVRMERHSSNALAIAHYLESLGCIKELYYPGMDHHSGHYLIGHQMKTAGGVLAFELNGNFSHAIQFMDALKMCKRAVSLGDAETLIQHPASMTHSPYTVEEREAAGISDTLIRMSIGLEHVEDIIQDLAQAFQTLDTENCDNRICDTQQNVA